MKEDDFEGKELPVDHDKNLEEVKEIAKLIAPLLEEEIGETWPLPVSRVLLYEYLTARMGPPFNLTYQDLYLALPAQRNAVGSYEEFGMEFTILADRSHPDVKPGDLMIFFVKPDSLYWDQFASGRGPKLVDRNKIPYPSISQIKQRRN